MAETRISFEQLTGAPFGEQSMGRGFGLPCIDPNPGVGKDFILKVEEPDGSPRNLHKQAIGDNTKIELRLIGGPDNDYLFVVKDDNGGKCRVDIGVVPEGTEVMFRFLYRGVYEVTIADDIPRD